METALILVESDGSTRFRKKDGEWERMVYLEKKQIGFILSDIDGTILDHKHQIDLDLIEEIKRLKQQAIPFVLASARSPKGMLPIAQELGIADWPLACYNGALIGGYDQKGKLVPIFSHEVKKAEAKTLVARIKADFPSVSINVYSGDQWYCEKVDQWARAEAAITKETPVETSLEQLLAQEAFEVHKFLLIGTTAEIQALHAACQNAGFLESAFYLSKENYLEVTHQAVGKDKALNELAAYFQVPLAQTLAIGDNFNDLPMIASAGIGVAMENAPELVKAKADFVTTSNTDHGVADALRRFVTE